VLEEGRPAGPTAGTLGPSDGTAREGSAALVGSSDGIPASTFPLICADSTYPTEPGLGIELCMSTAAKAVTAPSCCGTPANRSPSGDDEAGRDRVTQRKHRDASSHVGEMRGWLRIGQKKVPVHKNLDP